MKRFLLIYFLALASIFPQGSRPPVTNLNGLSDVTLTSPADGQALIFSTGAGNQWINSVIPGGALSTLTDVTIVTPADNQLLKYSIASSKWSNYGPLNFTDLIGNIAVSQMNSGSGASSTTFWRGDNTWATTTSADAGTTGNVMTSDGVNWISTAPAGPIKVISLKTGTSYTPSTGVRALYVECIGGGGGGGGALASASTCAVGGGGGGGGYASVYIASPKSSYTYAVGGGGTAGTSAGTNGGGGGTTSFDSPSVCTTTGGSGGIGLASGGTTSTRWTPSASGTGTVGDVLAEGDSGEGGIRFSGTQGNGGYGGGSRFGGRRSSQAAGAAAAGFSGTLYGGGGSGACSYSTTGFAGGVGGAGIIIVTEYF
jgi:hypothetical protein